jgi:hypothetical protein
MLAGISKTAREASLTGQLSGGKAVAIRQYNAILTRIAELGVTSSDLFAPLSEEASFDEVGVAASQLADFLREDEEEEHRRRWRHGGGVFEASPGHVKIVGFPGNISDLGDVLREYLPDFIKQKVAHAFKFQVQTSDKGCEEARESPAPPTPPTPPEPPAPPGSKPTRLDDIEARLADVSAQMQNVAEQMRRPDVSPEEIQTLAHDMSQLAQRQAELARERTTVKVGEQ